MSYHRTARRGMGAATAQQVSAGGSAVGSTVGLIAGSSAVGSIVSSALSALAPIISGVINGCGESCEVTTQWANQAESALQQNIAAYFSLPAPRSTVDQAAALNNFTSVWNALVDNCNNPSLGAPGQRCITDRQAGACTWHQTTTPPWGSPVAGACWNWWNGYHDPIANDPNVYTPSTSSSAGGSTSAAASTGTLSPLLLLAAAALVVGLVVAH
jgi:hypothetical protein